MNYSYFVWLWLIVAVIIIFVAALLGRLVSPKHNPLWIFIDDRQRVSLSRFQVILWTILILSLWISTSLYIRTTASIPSELLALMGISLGSSVIADAIKAGKDLDPNVKIINGSTKFSQMFLVEEGDSTIDIIDVAKFQNFLITLTLMLVYITTVIAQLNSMISTAALPSVSSSMVTLLGISHAGYLGGKLPNRASGPSVSTSDPADGDTVSAPTSITTTFDGSGISPYSAYGSIKLEDINNNVPTIIPIGKAISNNVLTITPSRSLASNTKLKVTIPAYAVQDASNNPLPQDYSFTFTTA